MDADALLPPVSRGMRTLTLSRSYREKPAIDAAAGRAFLEKHNRPTTGLQSWAGMRDF